MPDVSRQTYPFSLPDLPYPYAALEPHIDEATMRLHHDKHHKTYVDKLNEALAKEPELQKLTLIELLRGVDKLPDARADCAVEEQRRRALQPRSVLEFTGAR